MSNNVKGLLINFISILLFIAMDSTVKYLTESFPIHQIMLFRNLSGLPFLILFVNFKFGIKKFKVNNKPLLFWRVSIGAISMWFMFKSYQLLSLGEATALIYSGPLILTIYSIFIFNEKVGIYRWSAVLIGFIGVWLIANPNTGAFNINVIYPLIAAFTWAAISCIIKTLSKTDNSYAMTFWFSIFGASASIIMIILFGWQEIKTLSHLLILISIGLLGTTAQLLMTISINYADVSLIAISKYLSIVGATVIGYLAWDYLPPNIAIFGIILIIFSGILTVVREIYIAKKIKSKKIIQESGNVRS